MQRSHRTYSAHTTHTDHSSELSEQDQWHQVGQKNKQVNRPQPPIPTQDSRVLIEELVMVTDLMPQLMSQEVISRDVYFGKYGQITKVILTTKKDLVNSFNINQAFITYANSLDSSLAIAAFHDFNHKKYKTSANYGTCKFCTSFIKGIPCKIEGCHFIHEARWQTINVKTVLKLTKREKLKPVFKKINDNLQYFIRKEHKEYLDSKIIRLNRHIYENNIKREKIQFPSIKDTMKSFGQRGFIDWDKYQQLKIQYKTHVRQSNKPRIDNLKFKEDKIVEKDSENEKKGMEEEIKSSNNMVQMQQYPEILRKYLLSGPFEKLKLAPQGQTKEKENNNDVEIYLNMMGPPDLNSYIHHKLVKQAHRTFPSQNSLFDFAKKPQSSNLRNPSHRKYKQIILSTLSTL